MNLRRITIATLAVLAISLTPANARHHSRGACDGIHRCVCGSTQTRYFGLPRIFNGHNLWQAIEWIRAFPHTTIHAGVVGYQHGGGPTGHVFRVVSYSGGCRATVADEKGVYDRNICSRGATFVEVNKWASNDQPVKKHYRHHKHYAAR